MRVTQVGSVAAPVVKRPAGRIGSARARSVRTLVALVATALSLIFAAAPAAHAQSAVDFEEPRTSPEVAGRYPGNVARADLDGDGDQDLAVPNDLEGEVTILLNNGAGDFSRPPTSPESAGEFPVSVAAADLDGDADQDLAVANLSSDKVTILLNNGAGDFSEAPTSPEVVGEGPFALAAADLDGDGDRDLAVTIIDSNEVTILLNNGAGDFSRAQTSPESAGEFPVSVAAADLDGDADQDLAVANHDTDNVTILLNNGAGDFSRPPTSPERVGDDPSSVAPADLDGDGDRDLAVTNYSSNNVTILLNNGRGDFSRAQTSPERVGEGPNSVTAADLDGDGDQDLAVANNYSHDVTILLNNGAGDFSRPPTSPERAGHAPASVAAADLDGDGDQDLAVGGEFSHVTILLNSPKVADLSVDKTAPRLVTEGQVFQYTLRVRNAGPDSASGVTLTDTLPAGVEFLSTSGASCTRAGRTVRCDLGTLAAGAQRTVTLRVRAKTSGDQVNRARVSSRTGDFDRSDNSDTATTTVPGPPQCTRSGTPGNDILRGTPGDDVICAGGGNDVVHGGGGDDTIRGGAGNDILRGEAGNDRLSGGYGNDIVYGGGGNDAIGGGAGNDVLRGEAGNDRLSGGDGNDQVNGGDSYDRLNAGRGRDILSGQDGGDYLNSRDGVGRNDAANGGPGDDDCDTDSGDTRTSC